ncbi:MAG: N-acetylmuramic acid 6-phosphate etherase [bacterium]|nr:N-acetylmuramic acid 6-phosphate etherase [bacterium]
MTDYSQLIEKLAELDTEAPNPNSTKIDSLPPGEIVRIINAEDQLVAKIVESELDHLAAVAQLYALTLRNNGRVFYIGAGTSGRLGVLDAAECPPTFGTDPDKIVGLISGGYDTLILSQEGVEDQREEAIKDLDKKNVSVSDLVIGLAASRRTPYTLSGLGHAQAQGAATVFIICNKTDSDFLANPIIKRLDQLICLPVGPEVITGSTRMKSGTAQKMALNIISTTAMVLMGKTYGNLMVDLQARSEKLAARSRKMLIDLLNITLERADQLLAEADGSVKLAIVMHKLNCNKGEAARRLAGANGIMSRLLQQHQIS